jgi:transposase-like protein
MATIASTRRSDFGMTCIQCGDALIAPDRSKYVNERSIHHHWRCTKCGCNFEMLVQLRPDPEMQIESAVMKECFPSLLVA